MISANKGKILNLKRREGSLEEKFLRNILHSHSNSIRVEANAFIVCTEIRYVLYIFFTDLRNEVLFGLCEKFIVEEFWVIWNTIYL